MMKLLAVLLVALVTVPLVLAVPAGYTTFFRLRMSGDFLFSCFFRRIIDIPTYLEGLLVHWVGSRLRERREGGSVFFLSLFIFFFSSHFRFPFRLVVSVDDASLGGYVVGNPLGSPPFRSSFLCKRWI
jgi:hypothetical protein